MSSLPYLSDARKCLVRVEDGVRLFECVECHAYRPRAEFPGWKRRICILCIGNRGQECVTCREVKPPTEFRVNDSTCAACRRAAHNPRKSRDRDLRNHYGITAADYDTLLAQQGGVCAVCGEPETAFDKRAGRIRYLAVDHDHTTGQIRALLCSNCNQALGHLKDDPARIRALLGYVERMQTPTT